MIYKQKSTDEAKNIDLIIEKQEDIDLLRTQLPEKMKGKWLNCKLNQDSIECRYQIDESLNVIVIISNLVFDAKIGFYPVVISYEGDLARELTIREHNEAVDSFIEILTDINIKYKNRELDYVNGEFVNIEKAGKKRLNKKVIFLALGVLTVFSIVAIWISNILPNKIANTIYNDYKVSRIEYKDAISKLDFIDKIGDVEWAKEKCNTLYNSHQAYERAKSYQSNRKYRKAIENFKDVIIDDENYKDAQEQIKNCKNNFYYSGTEIPSYSGVTGVNLHNMDKQPLFTIYYYSYASNGNISKILDDLVLYADELKISGWNLIEEENEVGSGYSVHTFVKGNDSIIMEIRYFQGTIGIIII